MKVCSSCKTTKALTEFYRKGKESICRPCYNKRVSDYLYPNKDAPRGLKSSSQRRETQARYREKHREKVRAIQREYVKNNLAKVLARTRKYQCAKKNATPKWLTYEHFKQMEAIYIEAGSRTKTEGVKYEVDHKVPLCGNSVCGLHVPWNLQIMEQGPNRKKHNKY